MGFRTDVPVPTESGSGLHLSQDDQLVSLAMHDLCEGEKRNNLNEYSLAKQYSRSIGKFMGRWYGEFVQRCFSYNFRTDERDLSQSLLQEAFYRHVVCEFRYLVQEFSGKIE